MNKPFLKWAGGKHKLIPFIKSHAPKEYHLLIEPFAGSMALSLGTDCDQYIINDVNPDLINLYTQLKDNRFDFIDYIESYFTQDNLSPHKYYELRTLFNETNNLYEKAALFLYLNRHGFNGLCRYNQSGLFNVPQGKYRTIYFPRKEMENFIHKSNKITLLCGDFDAASKYADKDAFVYCDPPYIPLTTTSSFTSYSKDSFGEREQKRLSLMARDIGCHVLVSNSDTKLSREIYGNSDDIVITDVQRNISALGSGRSKVSEILAIYFKKQ